MNTSHNQTKQPATKPAHTPTPWSVYQRDMILGQSYQAILDPAGTILFKTTVSRADEDVAIDAANAALIVRAVNSHALLIEALEAAMLELEANKVAMIGPEWASQRTMTGGALAKCARALHNAKAQA